MVKALEFVFSDVWHFIGICVFLMILALWKPVEINVLNGYLRDRRDDDDME